MECYFCKELMNIYDVQQSVSPLGTKKVKPAHIYCGITPEDYFNVVSPDGYKCTFSTREEAEEVADDENENYETKLFTVEKIRMVPRFFESLEEFSGW